ncbi:unnamed protein product [Moneuplotes crassus]|uniref:Uncharacterized protein n=1 Tax=Euplotes crassus TaxID=5936 RepID=A0AAD1U9D4_EUPCR|nr:unnamed protein product [Moneuplotes crassus]
MACLSGRVKTSELYQHFELCLKFLTTHRDNLRCNEEEDPNSKIRKIKPTKKREIKENQKLSDDQEQNVMFASKELQDGCISEEDQDYSLILEELVACNNEFYSLCFKKVKGSYFIPNVVELISRYKMLQNEITPGDAKLIIENEKNHECRFIKSLCCLKHEYACEYPAMILNFVINMKRSLLCLLHYALICINKSASLFHTGMDADKYMKVCHKNFTKECSKILFLKTCAPFLSLNAKDILDPETVKCQTDWNLNQCMISNDSEILQKGLMIANVFDSLLQIKTRFYSEDFLLVLFSPNCDKCEIFLSDIVKDTNFKPPEECEDSLYIPLFDVIRVFIENCFLNPAKVEYFERELLKGMQLQVEYLKQKLADEIKPKIIRKKKKIDVNDLYDKFHTKFQVNLEILTCYNWKIYEEEVAQLFSEIEAAIDNLSHLYRKDQDKGVKKEKPKRNHRFYEK